MPKKSTGTSSRKHGSTRGRARTKTGSKTSPRRGKITTRTSKKTVHRTGSKNAGITYVFECTRQECGYQIVREEKADTGKLRFDLKCPKCHNREFKCLGPGDLPTPEIGYTIQAPQIDLDNTGPVTLGSS